MPTRRRRARISWWLLLLGVLWAPGSAVAHGVAHHRQAGQRAAHERAEIAQLVAHATSELMALEAADHHGDHDDLPPHDGLPSRADSVLEMPSRVVMPSPAYVETGVGETLSAFAARPRVVRDTGPPPQLRAPPTV